MGNPFIIFGYMIWCLVTLGLWIIGIGLLFDSAEQGDGAEAGVGLVALLLGMLSTAFWLSTLEV